MVTASYQVNLASMHEQRCQQCHDNNVVTTYIVHQVETGMSTIVNMVVLSIQTFAVPTAMKNLKVASSSLNNIVETILNNINCWSNNVAQARSINLFLILYHK